MRIDGFIFGSALTRVQRGGADWVISTSLFVLGFLGVCISLAVANAAVAQELTISEVESLVRARYFEGLPEAEARRVGPNAIARLTQMLDEPSESAAHANILMVLGISGHPGSFEAIDDWGSESPDGVVDRDFFRAWQAVPYSLGHLASEDARAFSRLEEWLEESEPPAWKFRHHQGERLLRLRRGAAANAMARTGRPHVAQILERAARGTADAVLEAQLRNALDEHGRVQMGRPR